MNTVRVEIPQEDIVLLYDVSFDKEEIEAFCEKLKQEASHTVHYDYQAIHGPFDRKMPLNIYENCDYFATYAISNYKKTTIRQEKALALTYRYEYDVCYYPYLTVLLHKVMKGDKGAFLELMNPTFNNEYLPIRAEIASRERQYMDLMEQNDYEMIDRKLEILEELKKLLLKVQQGDYENPLCKYYEEARKLFQIQGKIITTDDLRIIKK